MDRTLLMTSQPAGDLAAALQARLGEPVEAIPVAALGRRLAEAHANGAARVVLLPVTPAAAWEWPERHQGVRLLRDRLPHLAIRLAPPPGWQSWAEIVAGRMEEGAVLTAAAGSTPEESSQLPRLAWLVSQHLKTPVPFAFSTESETSTAGIPAFGVVPSPALCDLLLRLRESALHDEFQMHPDWGSAAIPADEAWAQDLEQRLDAMLPPQYKGRTDSVSPRSMGTAALVYGPDGKVAWDRVWTTFCDLALAGGPAHRGTLLEAVTPAEAMEDPAAYARVQEELERGISLATGLPVVRSVSPGWVGVRCDNEAMAIWLLRAIIVENVMVRREGEVLYLPAGPRFRVHREIKNVITSLAKTCHYWKAHRRAPAG